MKFFIVLVVLIIIYFVYAHPIVTSVAAYKIAEPAVAFEQFVDNPDITILVAGDSTGVGTGATDPANSTAGRLGADFPQANIKNISKNGLKVIGLENKLKNLKDDKYDVMLLQIGANDIVRFSSESEVKASLDYILKYASEHSKNALVVTSSNIGTTPIFRYPISYLYEKRTDSIQSIFRNKIDEYENITYVELDTEENNKKFEDNPEKYFASDEFHPSDSGYEIWYENIKKHLKLN